MNSVPGHIPPKVCIRPHIKVEGAADPGQPARPPLRGHQRRWAEEGEDRRLGLLVRQSYEKGKRLVKRLGGRERERERLGRDEEERERQGTD